MSRWRFGMLRLSLLLGGAAAAQDPGSPASSVVLENGARCLLVPVAEWDHAAVFVGVHAGVHVEPAGRNGLAHLAEHLFLHGRAAADREVDAFAELSRHGPFGMPYQDANAETLPELTYFYAIQPPDRLERAIALFAHKFDGVRFDEEVFERERGRVLAEIESVARTLEQRPELARALRALTRRPKAGDADAVRALAPGDVDAFLRRHYRPERTTWIVVGAFDAASVEGWLREHVGALQPRDGTALAEGPPDSRGEHAWIEHDVAVTDARERAALAVFAALWVKHLGGTNYVEPLPGGGFRIAAQTHGHGALRAARQALIERIEPRAFERARAAVVREAEGQVRLERQGWSLGRGAADRATATRMVLQGMIARLRAEAAGGEAWRAALAELDAQTVRAVAARLLTTANERLGSG